MSKQEQLDAVRKRILDELHDPLRAAAKNMVFGKGNPDAPILFIGEAPGEKEDLQGIPFVGAAGRELDKLLKSINLSLEEVYIANILKYRPPGNRNPNVDEIRAHTPYLIEQIRIIQPAVICTLGNFSTKFVLASFNVDGMTKVGGISTLHGKPAEMMVQGMSFTVFPLYHPAAMLYNPNLRKDLEADFQAIGKFLEEHGREPPKRKDKSLMDF